MSLSSEHDAKVVILGASGVGKTCIGLRFVKGQFVSYSRTQHSGEVVHGRKGSEKRVVSWLVNRHRSGGNGATPS
eukprot:scaffold2270_cov31-Tisochrysis_lutea.AAC.1